jgi:hypothetical protein
LTFLGLNDFEFETMFEEYLKYLYILLLCQLVRGKKKKNYNFYKVFHRKKSPKFDKFTTFHFKENNIEITKFRLKVRRSHQRYIVRLKKKSTFLSDLYSQIWLNPLVEDSPIPPTNYHKEIENKEASSTRRRG